MQLVSECVGRLLLPADWLPILSAHLDLTALIAQAAGRAYTEGGAEQAVAGGSGAGLRSAGDLGLLQLAVLVAQCPEGARLLHEQAALERLAAVSRHLLAAKGGGLAPFASLEMPGAGRGAGAGWCARGAGRGVQVMPCPRPPHMGDPTPHSFTLLPLILPPPIAAAAAGIASPLPPLAPSSPALRLGGRRARRALWWTSPLPTSRRREGGQPLLPAGRRCISSGACCSASPPHSSAHWGSTLM